MKKNMICLIVAAVAVFSLVFLPFFASTDNDGTWSLVDLPEGLDLFDEFCTIAWVLAIIACAGAIYGAYMKDKQMTFIASTVAAVLLLLSMIAKPSEWDGVKFGIGFWFGFLGSAATAVMVKVFEKEWDEQ